jgi:hypothetical protein
MKLVAVAKQDQRVAGMRIPGDGDEAHGSGYAGRGRG